MTILEFLEARIETDRGEAQYTLNLLEPSAPVMLGSLRSTITNTCLRVLADVETKRAIIEMHAGDHACGHWPTGCPTVRRVAADYSEHSDYQGWL